MEFQPLIFFDIFLDGTASRSTIPSSAKTGLHAKSSPAFQGSGFRLHCLGVRQAHPPRQRLRGPSNRAYGPEKSIRGFFWDCRIATQFCRLLSRPSLGSLIFIKYENPSVDFSGDCRIATQFCMLLSRPSMGFVIFIKYEKFHTLKKNQLFLRIYVQFQTFTFYILYGGKNK